MTEAARPVVALLESRMSRECARLVVKHGGEPLLAPALKEDCTTSPELVRKIVTDIEAGRYEVVVFMTGVAVSQLFEAAEQAGARAALVSGLRNITTVTRGPKPTAALRGFGVPPTLLARDAFTSSEVIDALSGIELNSCRILLFHYGERSAALAETLLARGVDLTEIWLYRWLLPDPTTALEALIEELVLGRVDALAITCQIQFRHLMQVAERIGRAEELLSALNERVVMAVVGPTCNAIVQSYGVTVHVIPEHPKMGPLVATLMRYLQLRGRRSDGQEAAPVRMPPVSRLPQSSAQN
ncbi:MAG: uroporphyrinogen-III synthase [Polyangiaceae bacterium]|nr:uroporphyrinogen-III synthase [Polyangiaceae bacterium]